MPSNEAAWLISEKQIPFVVKEAPYPTVTPDEVVVENKAVAINPVDWKLQREAIFPLQYPTILGTDVCGVVAEVGSNVKNVKPGDRVTATAHNLASGGDAVHGAYQKYTLHNHTLVAPIPSSMSFEQGSVFPLAVSTASAGLYEKNFLGLQLPSVNVKPTGESLLIWGGAGSVGCMAIQLATASGYEVTTTASPKNEELVKSLGAKYVFNHRSPTVVDELVDHFKGKTLAGVYDAVGTGEPAIQSSQVLSRSQGKKFVASVLPPPKEKLAEGTDGEWIFGMSILASGIAKNIYIDFMPEALKQGKMVPKPDPLVVGKSLNDVQAANDKHAEGNISAAKVVCLV